MPAHEAGPRISRRERLALAGVCAAALALRLLHVQQVVAHDPFHAAPSLDPLLYHEAALRLVRGEGFGGEVLAWGPLYPLFLAAIYAVAGAEPTAAIVVQALLGTLTVALVWRLARDVFDAPAALTAAGLAAVYPMSLFYEGTLMVTNLQVPLNLLALLGVVRGVRRPAPRWWALAGAALGLSALVRPNVLLFGAFALPWIAWSLRERAGARRRLALAAAFCGATALALAPATAYNLAVGGDLVLVSSTGGANLYVGNHRRADGTWGVPPIFGRTLADDAGEMGRVFHAHAEREAGRALSPAEGSRWWTAAALREIRADPARWLRLEFRKLLLFFNALEPYSSRSFEVSRDFSWVLRLPLPGFGVVAPLALTGLVIGRVPLRRQAPLLAMIATYLVSALVFFVLSHYRMPAVPVFLVLAGAGVVALADLLRPPRPAELAVAGLSLAVFAGLAQLPVLRDDLATARANAGNRYRDLGRWEEAAAQYARAIALAPGFLPPRVNLALVLEKGGRREGARRAWGWVRDEAERRGADAIAERARRHLAGLDEPGERARAVPPPPPPVRPSNEESTGAR